MRVSLQFLGCKVNQAEIAELEQALKAGGHELVGPKDQPDVCVVNTCTVTAKSDHQSRQLIRRAARTGARVIVTGCYSEMNPNNVKKMENVSTPVNERFQTLKKFSDITAYSDYSYQYEDQYPNQ